MKGILCLSVLIFLVLGTTACREREEVAPFNENAKIKSIRLPNTILLGSFGIPDFFITNVGYKEDKIEYIKTVGEVNGKTSLLDSTYFFYTNGKLDSAIRFKAKELFIATNPHLETFKYSFERNTAGEIMSSKLESTDGNPGQITHFTYQNGLVTSIANEYSIDSITYNSQGNPKLIKTFARPDKWHPTANLRWVLEITDFARSYSPYYAISKRLGFPILLRFNDGISTLNINELARNSIKSFNTKSRSFESKYDYLYDVDIQGRVKSQYREVAAELKTTFEYY